MRTAAAFLIAALAAFAGDARALTGTPAQKLSVIATLGVEAAHKTDELERDAARAATAGGAAAPLPRFEDAEKKCRAEFSMAGLMRRLESGELGRSDRVVGGMFEDAERYFECYGYAVGSADQCVNLKWFQQDLGPTAHNREDLCREIFRKLTLSKSVIDGDPGAEKLCEGLYTSMIESDDQVIREGTIPETCAIIAGDKDPESVCRKRSNLWIRPFTEHQMKECVFYQAVRTGNEKFCGLFPEKEKYCREFAAYKRAREAGKPELCEGAMNCRLLLGQGPNSCDSSAEKIRDFYCREAAASESVGEAAGLPALRARSKSAAAGMKRWRELMDSFPDKDLPAYREELGRLEREEKRLDAVRGRIAGMKGS